MLTREQVEQKIPKEYKDAMKDPLLGEFISTMSLWGVLIDNGLIKDFEAVEQYQKNLWEKALREVTINKLLAMED